MNVGIDATQQSYGVFYERLYVSRCCVFGSETDASAQGKQRLVSSHDLDSSDIDASMIVLA